MEAEYPDGAQSLHTGNAISYKKESGEEVFFNFTAIPGQGYRTVRAGTRVQFELVENKTGLTARNIQPMK